MVAVFDSPAAVQELEASFLKDLEIMLRTLVAGAVRPAFKSRAATLKPAKKAVPRSISRKPGDRR